MQFLTDFADQAVILPLAVMVGLALLAAGWLRGALAWWTTIGVTLGVMLVLKLVFIACGRWVPELSLHSPSGHTASAAVVYGGMVGLAVPRRVNIAANVIAALALALLFGVTRLALRAHSVAEVLVGGAIGMIGALVLVWLAGDRPATTPQLRLCAFIGGTVVAIGLALHGQHLGAERVIHWASFAMWPLSQCSKAGALPQTPPGAEPLDLIPNSLE